MIPQTIYGSLTRYEWIKSFLNKKQKIIDLGCGTGVMVTLPLLKEGYDVIGVDLCSKSIEYGKKLFIKEGIPEDKLICMDLKDVDISPNVIILSEVLEHLTDIQYNQLITLCLEKLSEDGLILITVPNGWGFFELDDFIWFKLKLGYVLQKLKMENLIILLKNKLLGYNTIFDTPSSLDFSPHIQRFTYRNFPQKLSQYDVSIIDRKGGSLISGPLSNLLFTGFSSFMKLNMFLGEKMPYLAAGFYFAVKKNE